MSSQRERVEIDLEGAISDSTTGKSSPRESEQSSERLLGRPSASSPTVNLGPYGGVVEASHPHVDLRKMEYRERGGCCDPRCDGLHWAPLYERSSPEGELFAELPGRQTPMATSADYIVGTVRCKQCHPAEPSKR